MKFHLEVVNSQKAGSVDNVHIYCMFEATDSGNMWKVWNTSFVGAKYGGGRYF